MISCTCVVCKTDFQKMRRRGSMEVCTRCSGNKRVREWKEANPERAKQHSGYGGTDAAKKKYAKSDRGHEIGRIKAKRWYKKNGSAYQCKRYAEDIQHRLSVVLRSRLVGAIKKGTKAGSAVRDLGCSILEFKDYIEAKFQPGMSWDNWGLRGWHIDHIKPLARFDLTDRVQLLKACHYTNLQTLWAVENIIKGAR